METQNKCFYCNEEAQEIVLTYINNYFINIQQNKYLGNITKTESAWLICTKCKKEKLQ